MGAVEGDVERLDTGVAEGDELGDGEGTADEVEGEVCFWVSR